MKVRDMIMRTPVTIDVGTTVNGAARMMAKHGLGSLIVTDGYRPVGVVTDRDLVVRALARDLPGDARVDGVMTMGVVAIDADADRAELVRTFGTHAVRRIPVVDGDRVIGVVTLDDMLMALSQDVDDLTRGLTAQLTFPHAADEPAVPAAR